MFYCKNIYSDFGRNLKIRNELKSCEYCSTEHRFNVRECSGVGAVIASRHIAIPRTASASTSNCLHINVQLLESHSLSVKRFKRPKFAPVSLPANFHLMFIDDSLMRVATADDDGPLFSSLTLKKLLNEDLCDFPFVYLNYQFNYLDTSCVLFLGSDIWELTGGWNRKKRELTPSRRTVVIAIFKHLSPTCPSRPLFYRISRAIGFRRKFKLWTMRLHGRFEQQ